VRQPEGVIAGGCEALTLFEQIGDADGVADVLDTRVNIAVHANPLPAAPMLDHVARLFKDAGRLLRVGTLRSNYGYVLMQMGRFEEALSNVEEALDLERTLAHPEGEAYCLWHRSEALASLGRVQEARESAEDALAIARRLGHREWTAAALRGLGVVCLAAGDLDGAEQAFRKCLDAATRIPIFSSWAASGLARALIARGDLYTAEHYVTKALSEGTPATQYEARLARAELAVARGDTDAQAIVLEALEMLDLAQAGNVGVIAARLRELAAEVSRAS
jgi:tetratricopeptide (TPR) repeat protein